MNNLHCAVQERITPRERLDDVLDVVTVWLHCVWETEAHGVPNALVIRTVKVETRYLYASSPSR